MPHDCNCTRYHSESCLDREFCRQVEGCRDGFREACPKSHSEKRNGRWWFANEIELGGLIKSNNTIEFRVRCIGCGRETSGIGNENFRVLVARGFKYRWTRRDSKIEQANCCVFGCEAIGFEYHHFAPSNTFPDANDWPILPICRQHHRYWHQMMNGYQWNTPAPQLNNGATQQHTEQETAQ